MLLQLSPLLQVISPSGLHETRRPEAGLENVVFTPKQHFRKETVCRREVEPAPDDGTVQVRLSTRYARAASVGAWVLRLTVNGLPVQRWRGALHAGRIRVRLQGIRRGDVIGLEIRTMQNRVGAGSWEKASRYVVEEVRFESLAVASTVKPSAHADFTDPRLDPAAIAPQAAAVPIEALLIRSRVLPELNWDVEQQWAVTTDHFVLPMLIVPRRAAAGSVVLCNGAVDLQRSQRRPVFQRSSWQAEIPQHQLYICDPGTVGAEALSLSWGHLSGGVWCIPVAAQAVRAVLGLLQGVRPLPRTYFGSSAGGFWALGLLHFDPGSAAVVNNAQFDCTRWMVGGVNALREARFRDALPATIRRAYPEETNVLKLLESRDEARLIDYHVNLSSGHDREVDLPQAEAFIRTNPEQAAELRIHAYEDPAALHNPMSQSRTLEAIRSSLSRIEGEG